MLSPDTSLQIKVSNLFPLLRYQMSQSHEVNGSYACENDKTLNGILKGEFGFPGCEPIHFLFCFNRQL